MNEQHLLYLAESYLQKSVFPHAAAVDSDVDALQNALSGMGQLGLLALRVPLEWGGLAVSEDTFYTFTELVARYSGALAFLQTQHQSAAAMLAQSQNEFLQQKYLQYLSNGQILVGVGFSHIRRRGEPLVAAVPVSGGYQVSGHVPWITGFGLFQDFIVAATLPDGQAVFGIVPFIKTQNKLSTITFSQPLTLAAMMSTNTVTATLTDWFLPEECVVSVKPAGWIHENDQKNVLKATGLALGCARAGLDVLQTTYSSKPLSFIAHTFAALDRELISCRIAITQAQHQCEPWEKRLQLRAWGIDLAVRCAHAAVTVSSGAANYSDNPAQRIYREALVFTVSGQTTAIMEATLASLVRFGFDTVGDNALQESNSLPLP